MKPKAGRGRSLRDEVLKVVFFIGTDEAGITTGAPINGIDGTAGFEGKTLLACLTFFGLGAFLAGTTLGATIFFASAIVLTMVLVLAIFLRLPLLRKS